MNTLITIVAFVLILSAIIIIHELGHLIAAKSFNVYCNEFSIGMGPLLFRVGKGETKFSLRLLPIGGYVSMAGEEGIEAGDIPYERTVKGIKTWKQVVVMAAGAAMNILLAWVVFVGIVMARGSVAGPTAPIISSVIEKSPAAGVGLLAGDEIVKVTLPDGTEIYPETFDEIVERTNAITDEKIIYSIEREGVTSDYVLTPAFIEEQNRYLVGIQGTPTIQPIEWYQSFGYGTDLMVTGFTQIISALGNLLSGVGLKDMSGPVGIYQATSQMVESGLLALMTWLALLSLNIGIFNLLPVPILDGGRIVIILIERLIGRKIGEKAETMIMFIGLALVVGLMVFATWNDIVRIFIH